MSEPGASALPPRLLAEIFARFPNGAFVLDGERRFVACRGRPVRTGVRAVS